MSNAMLKQERIHIPTRDRSIVVKARPAMSNEGASHEKQVEKAFDKGFERYHRALERLSKI